MQVHFRECDWFSLWIWIEFQEYLNERQKQTIDEIFASWFLLGKLGGFNATNLQVLEAGVDVSYLDYNVEDMESEMMAVMHNMADVEYEGNWARCWVDLGTTDALSLDVLINSLYRLSEEYVPITAVYIGGEQEDWKIDRRYD
jgi:hypothetical protein